MSGLSSVRNELRRVLRRWLKACLTMVTASYDHARRRDTITDPDYGTLVTVFDAYGRLKSSASSRESAAHTQTTTVYDGLDRVLGVTDGLEGTVTQYTYNETGVEKGTLDEILSRKQGGSDIQRIAYEYDTLARTRGIKEQRGTTERKTEVNYDGQSRVARLVHPSGVTVNYGYQQGYLKNVTDGNGNLLWMTGDMDAGGQLLEARMGNGAVTRYAYDTLMHRLERIATTKNLQNLTYGYDNFGNLASRKDNIKNMEETFTYDGMNRLTGVTLKRPSGQDLVCSVTYDAPGRMTSRQADNSFYYTYGYDHQRIRMEEHIGNNTRTIQYILKDNLGSWTTITDGDGVVEQRLSYDAWGNLRNPNTWSGDFSGTPMFDRGFTGHEHLYDFDLINMNGRMYDPVMSGFLSVDQYVQSPGNSQNFNRYAYCLNNPLRYVDPDGEEFLTSAIIIGSLLVGAYSGGVLTNGGEYNPIKWDWSSSNTYDGMLLGGVFGGLSGFAGVSIAGMGFAFCNTASIAASSLIYSTGMHWTGKCTNFDYGISLSIGVASFDFTHGKLGYLGKRGNSILQNIGYGFGALANLQDFVAGFNGTKIQVKSRKELAGHSELGEYSNNGIYQDGDINININININALLPVTAPVLLNTELAIRSFGIGISPYLIQ